jgi:hypothetical protein
MKRTKPAEKRTPRTNSSHIAALKLSRAQEKELAERLLTKAERGDVYLLIARKSIEDEPATAEILMITASDAANWGFDSRTAIDVGEIRE